MQKPPIKNNPAFLTDEELLSAFVVRYEDLQLIVGVIRENTRESNQHVLIVGPRGIGKTMLVQRISLEVRRDADLREKWYPLVFSEESYEVGTAGEFWLESLFHLGRQTGDPRWSSTYEDLKREPVEDRLRERALAQLMDYADSHKKRILLVVENLNTILSGQMSDEHAWKLRGTLMHEPRLMLLATATTRIDTPEDTSKAMFELFKSHVLEPLNDTECQAVWQSVAGQELGCRRIRAVSILTGGNPRLIAIISHFGARLSFAELMQEMTNLVDDHTDYFKSQIDALPSTERKVYVALADLWDPSTARETAAAARLDVSATSSLLKRLAGRGVVTEIPGKTRTKRYQVAERLYNIYYLMRRRGAPSERVKAVVQFMVQFYEETELVDVARLLTEEACHLSREDRQYHYHAFEGIIRTTPSEVRYRILQRTPWGFLEAPDRPDSLRNLLGELGVGTDCPCDFQKHPNEDIQKLIRNGRVMARDGNKKEAEKAFREVISIDPTYSDAFLHLGNLLQEQPERRQEAEQAFRKATIAAVNDPCAWDYLGRFLSRDESNLLEAEHAFQKAIESYPDCQDAFVGLAKLAKHSPGREQEVAPLYAKAEEACIRRTEKWPERSQHWRFLARIRHEYQKHFDDAEIAYRQAIKTNPENALAWEGLGRLLHYKMKRFEEAETAYRRAIEINSTFIDAMGNLGLLLRDDLNKLDEATEQFAKILEIESGKKPGTWVEMGHLYKLQERFSDAESAYKRALEITPQFHLAWFYLALLFHERLERYADAEAAYRKAIETDQKHSCPREGLVVLLLKNLKRPESALELAQQSLEVIPKKTSLRNNLAMAFYRHGPSRYLEYAEQWAREAVASDSSPANAHTLACVLAREGKSVEALVSLRKLLDNPEFAGAKIEDMIRLFSELVAAGCAEEALVSMRDSKSVTVLEPVFIALQMHTGHEVNVAPEIAEIGKDVLQKFRERLEVRTDE